MRLFREHGCACTAQGADREALRLSQGQVSSRQQPRLLHIRRFEGKTATGKIENIYKFDAEPVGDGPGGHFIIS
jgi:hypothetical protein